MGGEVRAPTVFLANALIAQRHFNAYLFADFLRQRIPRRASHRQAQAVTRDRQLSSERTGCPSRSRLAAGAEEHCLCSTSRRGWTRRRGLGSRVR